MTMMGRQIILIIILIFGVVFILYNSYTPLKFNGIKAPSPRLVNDFFNKTRTEQRTEKQSMTKELLRSSKNDFQIKMKERKEHLNKFCKQRKSENEFPSKFHTFN